MDLLRLSIQQINTTGIDSTDIASKSSVNTVQANVTAANTWVNANDHTTLLSARSNDWNTLLTAQSNDGATLLTARANDFSTFTTLTANTYNTLLTARANDFATYTTLNASINSVQSNLTSVIGAAPSTLDTLAEIAAALENDANIAVTLVTAIGTVQSNLTTLTGTTAANDYNSYTTLTANTYNTLLAAQANDFNSFNTLTANIYNTLLDTRANDFNSFTTLTANIYNTFAYLNANVGGGGGDVANAWVNANDYNSYTTLTANIYNTYTSLFANLGVGGGNVTNTVSITPVFSGALRTTNATQSLGTASWTTLTGYDNVIYDTNSFTSVADRFTIPSGVTKVKLAGSVAGTSAIGQLITRILKNANTAISYTTEVDIESTGADNGIAITPVVSVVEGDYFVLQAFSDNSRTISVELVSWFSIEVVEGSVLTATANLTISSAGNAWVNANDYATLLSARANDYNSFTTLTANTYNTLLAAQANDLATLNTARANDFNSFNTLTANTYNTLLDTRANDYNSFTTLTANIYNTFAYLNANVGGGGGDVANAWVNANDYATYITLQANLNSVSSNVDNVTANLYNTYTSLANVYSEKFEVNGSTNVFTLSRSITSEEALLVYLDGVLQHSDSYVISGTTLTIANTTPIPVTTLGVRSLSALATSAGESSGGSTYLKTFALG
jgi:hypothetical protein